MFLKRNLSLGLAAVSILAVIAGPGLSRAQSTPINPSPPPAHTGDTQQATQVDELVVTGSHIRRTNFNTPAPVQIITAQDSQLEGLIDPASILQRSTIAAGSVQLNNQFSGFVTNGGPGLDSISLRGLGDQRTLVLLNGRRLNPAGVSGTVAAVDLNVIPSALVDRYEILKDGASSIYGSDAIGGVVNVITKTKFDGLTIETENSLPQRGAGNIYDVAISGGRVRDNYHVLAGLEFYRQEAVRIGDLPGGQCPSDLQKLPGGSSYNFDRTNADGSRYCAFTQTDEVSNFDTGELFVYDPTQPASMPYSLFNQSSYGSNPRFTNIATDKRERQVDASSPLQRTSLTVLGGVDLPHRAEFYFEGLLTYRQSQQNAYLPQFFPATDETIIGASFSPFNPFPDFVQPVMTLPVAKFSQNVLSSRVLAGVRGDFGSFLQGWKWDASVTYGRSSADYYAHPQLTSRVLNALDVVEVAPGAYPNLERTSAVTGLNYTCRINTIDPNARCYPLNFFESSKTLASDPVLAYLTATDHGRTIYNQVILSATMDGPLFKLPAGEVQGVVGLEFRHDDLYDNPGPHAVATDYFNQSTAGITQGDESVGEAYVEVEAPLLKGLPLVDSLTVNASGRFTDYRTAGFGMTYKVGVNWQLIPSLRIRGTYGTSYRGPALFENYLAAQTSFTGALDPCAHYGDHADPSSNLYKNCLSEGLDPQAFSGYSSSPEVFTQGALGRLKSETSKNLTVGPVWQPSFIDLQLGFDYYRIEVDNQIFTIGASNILNLCYDSKDFRNGSPYCTLISTRTSQGDIALINDSYINIAREIVSGFDVNWRYRHKFSFGELQLDGEATFALEDNQELIPGTSLTNYTGTFGEPPVVWDGNLRFKHGSWTVLWNTFFIGRQSEYSQTGDPQSRYKEFQEAQYYHSISLTYEADKWTATFGIRNLLDSYPPVISNNPNTGFAPRVGEFANGYGNLQLYGRTFFVRLKRDF
jgi:iron complex outermembrane receptor protein